MHRSLVEFASGSSDKYEMFRFLSFSPVQCTQCLFRVYAGHQVSSLVLSKTKRTDTAATMLHRVEIAMDTTVEQQLTAEISDDDSSDISIGEQVP